MTVVPHGPDAIEAWSTCFLFPFGPMTQGGVRPRDPGTNAFRHWLDPNPANVMTFSADGTASGGFKKRPDSQKRAFQKVETRDLAGDWRGCACIPLMPLWQFSIIFCTKKKAINQDRYEESGRGFVLGLPLPVETTTRTRKYVNGHPTNGFAKDGGSHPMDVLWYRDPGCAGDCDPYR